MFGDSFTTNNKIQPAHILLDQHHINYIHLQKSNPFPYDFPLYIYIYIYICIYIEILSLSPSLSYNFPTEIPAQDNGSIQGQLYKEVMKRLKAQTCSRRDMQLISADLFFFRCSMMIHDDPQVYVAQKDDTNSRCVLSNISNMKYLICRSVWFFDIANLDYDTWYA